MRTIDSARRADAHDGDVGIVELVRQRGHSRNATIGMGGGNQIIKAGFIDRCAAFVKRGDLGLADIDPDDRVPLAGDAACGGRADIPQSEYGNLHEQSPKARPFEPRLG